MSTASEEPANVNPLDALESLYAPPRRPTPPPGGERAEPRLAAVNDAPVPRMPRPTPPRTVPTPDERIENAMAGFVRRQFEPEVVPEPVDFKLEGMRRKVVASAIGVVAVVAIAAVVALLSFSIFPKERDAIQSFAAAVPAAPAAATAATPAAPPSEAAKPALSQFRALVAPAGASPQSQGFSHEQSERLLQQFVQWRQKSADKP
jgi:hypothetical protein